jgi:hypothetical protein
MLAASDQSVELESGETRFADSDSAAEVEQELRKMAMAVA